MKQILQLLLLFTLFSCTESPLEPSKVEQFSTISKSGELTSTDFDDKAIIDIQQWSDTLYVAVEDSSGVSSIELLNSSSLSKIGSLSSWSVDSAVTGSFSYTTNLLVTERFLFVGSMSSLITVFDRSTLSYVTTIGTGKWYGDENFLLVHTFAMTATEDKLFVRDKHNIRVYKLEDLLPENSTKVQKVAQSVQLGPNSYKKRHGMIVYNNNIYVTDYPNDKIYIFSPNDFTEANFSVAPQDSISLSHPPLDIATKDNQLIWVTSKGTLDFYDPSSGETTQRSELEGHTLASPQIANIYKNRLYLLENDALTICDIEYYDLEIYR